MQIVFVTLMRKACLKNERGYKEKPLGFGLDYCGIATLIMGSYVPWLYYGFYCESKQMLIYLSVVLFLGISSFVVSLWDRFSEPKFRALRAVTPDSKFGEFVQYGDLENRGCVFMGFGLSGVIPAVHYAVSQGWLNAVNQAALGPLILMGALYILGALFYTLRIPERFFPGSCDIIVIKYLKILHPFIEYYLRHVNVFPSCVSFSWVKLPYQGLL
ncbi:hypothetical protein J437_LFUL016617 [Ladona fulva]|uniref:Uncharacterized protein n=1 Tax=Ladona fulva TaxID=123851 RepID=A0A8K0KRJ2_LADFU|nr:hypothetical protein J437_LFUL016617 [Ladona fulva]